ncbi:NAD-dependent epimerase/dehydratase family protein [Biformimicrobium ophioploci]|uniref:NAD-dependent epimerase/dehydratase family protein n=1 Tax=Biformimicrobium ophioploci TaxID=3036711 RepID=A0ABQ6M1Y6_9GAMM|nr:NAD-dependent epimerase/dehydratase family protein [Microbulbifer sp. NKW57]GMG88321.1 NAD-dependent epimerase/dehydratase family protein [Microbulbifer sp. NKW57]
MIGVIGANGFVGRALLAHYETTGVDFYTVTRAGNKHQRKALSQDEFLGSGSTELLKKTDTIVYLASATKPRENIDVRDEIQLSVIPFLNYLRRAMETNNKVKLVYLSSGGQVYGTDHKKNIVESTLLSPETPYGWGKEAVEKTIEYYSRTNGLRYAILRPSNPIGAHQVFHSFGVLPKLIECAYNRRQFEIIGSGNSSRDYLDVEDLCSAIELAAKHPASGVWNVGSGHETSIYDLIQLVERITKKNIKVAINTSQEQLENAKQDRTPLDITKIRADLGWEPKIDLDTSIRRIANFYQDLQSGKIA